MIHTNSLFKPDVVMKANLVKSLEDAKVSELGAQAGRLVMLRRMGFQLPTTFVCGSRGFDEYISGNLVVLEHLKKELERVLSDQKAYCISPSISVDPIKGTDPTSEFGKLNAKGEEQIIEAILTTWKLANKPEYTDGRKNKRVRVSVIIQERIPADYSGVVFTRNPTNGSDEVIVESVVGADMLEKDQIGTSLWRYKWGIWQERPETKGRYTDVVTEVIREAKRIEKKLSCPVRVEWTHKGNSTYLLGLNALPSLKGISIYSNKMAKERLPGAIKPLVWDINVVLFNSSWKRILAEAVGKHAEAIELSKTSRQFYHRAYFNMGVFGDVFEFLGMPRESMEIILGTEIGPEKPTLRPSIRMLRHFPRIAFFGLDKLMFSRKLSKFLEIQYPRLVFLRSRDLEELDKARTLEYIEELVKINREASYFTIVTQMLNGFCSMALKTYMKKIGVDIKEIDLEKKMRIPQDIDPDHQLSVLRSEYRKLPQTVKLKQDATYSDLVKSSKGTAFEKLLTDFLLRFGHVSDSSTDFSKPQLKETPSLALKMITIDENEIGKTPRDKTGIYGPLENLVGRFFLRIPFDYLARLREYTERASYIQSFGFALFRDYFLHLGKLFVKEGSLEERQDVFYLTLGEVRESCKTKEIKEQYKDMVRRRKLEMTEHEDVLLPETIYGDATPFPLTGKSAFATLKGLAASRGYYEGKIKIVRGFGDFGKIEHGDIIVVPYSHVSWTPLFEKAKALISESGGMLSHCSILARERHIPAVVSVKGALDLRDNMRVVVDGYKGEVIIVK